MNNATTANTVEKLISEFKTFADSGVSEDDIQMAQRVLESQISDLQQEQQLKPGKKKGLLFDNIVANRDLERKLKDQDTPLEFFYDIFNDKEIHIDFRVKAATAAARYVHRTLPAQVEHTGKDGGAIEVTHNEARDRLMAVLFEGESSEAIIDDIQDAEYELVDPEPSEPNELAKETSDDK